MSSFKILLLFHSYLENKRVKTKVKSNNKKFCKLSPVTEIKFSKNTLERLPFEKIMFIPLKRVSIYRSSSNQGTTACITFKEIF